MFLHSFWTSHQCNMCTSFLLYQGYKCNENWPTVAHLGHGTFQFFVQYLDFDQDLIEKPKHVCCAVFPQKVGSSRTQSLNNFF